MTIFFSKNKIKLIGLQYWHSISTLNNKNKIRKKWTKIKLGKNGQKKRRELLIKVNIFRK
jgi:hypothetical protein